MSTPPSPGPLPSPSSSPLLISIAIITPAFLLLVNILLLCNPGLFGLLPATWGKVNLGPALGLVELGLLTSAGLFRCHALHVGTRSPQAVFMTPIWAFIFEALCFIYIGSAATLAEPISAGLTICLVIWSLIGNWELFQSILVRNVFARLSIILIGITSETCGCMIEILRITMDSLVNIIDIVKDGLTNVLDIVITNLRIWEAPSIPAPVEVGEPPAYNGPPQNGSGCIGK